MWPRDEFAQTFFNYIHQRLPGLTINKEFCATLTSELPEHISPDQLWRVMRSVVKSHTKKQPGFVYPIDFRQKMPKTLSIEEIAEELLKITLHAIRIQPSDKPTAALTRETLTIECFGHNHDLAGLFLCVELRSLFRAMADGGFHREHGKLCTEAYKRTTFGVTGSPTDHVH